MSRALDCGGEHALVLRAHAGALLRHHARLRIHEFAEQVGIFVVNDLRIRRAEIALIGLHRFHIRTECHLG